MSHYQSCHINISITLIYVIVTFYYHCMPIRYINDLVSMILLNLDVADNIICGHFIRIHSFSILITCVTLSVCMDPSTHCDKLTSILFLMTDTSNTH